MKLPSNFPTIFAFGLAVLTLAIIAAVLPTKQTTPTDYFAFRAEYEDSIDTESRIAANVGQINQPVINESFDTINPNSENDETKKLIRSPSDLIVRMIEDESTVAKQKADEDEIMRASAIAENDLLKCNNISSERAMRECLNVIYFKEAVATANLSRCSLIEGEESKLRCQNYVSLML